MPRTKVVKKESQAPLGEVAKFDKQLEAIYHREIEALNKQEEMTLAKYGLLAKQHKLAIPISVGNKKLKELRKNINWHTTISSMKQYSALNSILSNDVTKKKSTDDGYLTSDSATETAGGSRQSRSTRRSKSAAPVRRSSRSSRSLSTNKTSVVCSTTKKPSRKSRSISRTSTRNRFVTPVNNKRLGTFDMVTPKIKPNTPSVVLRRPGQGEIAISLRGSPLMTTSMVSETTANVNIPLADGRMINIQPMKGLRASEIPDLDPEIQRQLQTLRDNLDKVCQLSRRK